MEHGTLLLRRANETQQLTRDVLMSFAKKLGVPRYNKLKKSELRDVLGLGGKMIVKK